MKYQVTMVFPLVADMSGETKQHIYTQDMEADCKEEALLKVKALEFIDIGDVFIIPANAVLYFVNLVGTKKSRKKRKGNGKGNNQ